MSPAFFFLTPSLFASFSSLFSENTLHSPSCQHCPAHSCATLIAGSKVRLSGVGTGTGSLGAACCLCGQYLGSSFWCCLLSLEAHSSPPCVELEGYRKEIWKQQITPADNRPPLSWKRDCELLRIITFFIVNCHICAAPILFWPKLQFVV